MKKHFLLFFFLPLFAFQMADWIGIQIDDRASVKFPSEPLTKEVNGNKVWVQDINGGRCMAMVVDFNKFGLDSAALALEMDKPASFEQFKTGFANQVDGASFVSEKNWVDHGRRTFEFVINMTSKDSAGFTKAYNKNIFAGTKMYSMSFYENDKKPQPELRERFFTSFRIN